MARYKSATEAIGALAGEAAAEATKEMLGKTELVFQMVRSRIKKELTQQQIADRMGCSASRISKLEAETDENLRWGDIVRYLTATGRTVSLTIGDEELPAAHRVRLHVFEIKRLIDELVALADESDGDSVIRDKINLFFGEVLFDFLLRFKESGNEPDGVITISASPAAAHQDAGDADNRHAKTSVRKTGGVKSVGGASNIVDKRTVFYVNEPGR
jgi:transcriptional regulator with XRE-family HTH domain